MPLLSIITITYNAEAFLERTLKSIVRQTDQDFEYLLIDGGSTDGTLAIANKYASRLDVLVSEPDKGLYDAMNKGQARAKGKYLWFMNAGDEIAEHDAVEKLKQLMAKDVDIIYSDTLMVASSGNLLGLRSVITPHKYHQNLTWQKYRLGMLVCHQSFIAKQSISSPYIQGNLSADIDWQINCLKHASSVVPYPGVLAKYLAGGISQQQQWRSWKDRYRVLRNHFGFFPNLFNHGIILLRSLVKPK